MNRGGWRASWKPTIGGYQWRSDRLRSLLGDCLYEGIWRFSSGAAAPSFWAPFARPQLGDDVGFDPVAAEHAVPHLAWYSPAQMVKWRSKFLGRPRQFARGDHIHQFAGIAACTTCHELLLRNGKNGYRCRNDGQGCSRGLTVTEKLAWLAIEAVLPEVIKSCQSLVSMINAASAGHDIALIETRICELEDRQRCLAGNWLHRKEAEALPAWVSEEERALADKKSHLQARLEQARISVCLADAIKTQVPQLTADPVSTLRQLGASRQGFLVRSLFRRIELEGSGHGNGRRVRVVRWKPNG